MNRPPKGKAAGPAQVIINDDALIRRTMPAAIIASLEADAARALVARPDIAVTVVNRHVGRGRTTLVVLYASYANPADNGLCVITFMGAEQSVAERVRRTLLELLSGPEGRGEGRKGAS
jgi:hypothetical protein